MASAAWTARRALIEMGRRMNAPVVGASSKGGWSLSPTLVRRWLSSLPPHEVVGMPSLSPTMEAGSIAQWKLSEGDAFSAGDIICEVETDKATVDFEAQDDGVIAKILKQSGSGEEIKVGQPIMVTVDDTDHVSAFADFVPDAAGGAAPPPAPQPPAPAPPTPPPAAAAPPPAPAPTAAAPTGGRVVASPLAHTLAKEMSLGPLSALAITGTGPNGRIIAADVREYQPSAAAAAQVPTATAAVPAAPTAVLPTPIAGVGFTDYVLSEEAKQIAAQLARSKSVIPHYYLTVDINVESLLSLRADLNASLTSKSKDPDAAPPISANDLLLKAAALSMNAVPSANASWMDSFVRVYDSVDINVVMGAGDALYAPVLRDVGRRGVKAISDDIRAALQVLQDDAEAPAAPQLPATVDMNALGTVTVLNLGMYGIKSCAPIVREPQAVCLALGAIRDCIVPNQQYDTSVEGSSMYSQVAMLTATLSCDHRVVDGAVGAQWLAAFKEHVESPSTLLL